MNHAPARLEGTHRRNRTRAACQESARERVQQGAREHSEVGRGGGQVRAGRGRHAGRRLAKHRTTRRTGGEMHAKGARAHEADSQVRTRVIRT